MVVATGLHVAQKRPTALAAEIAETEQTTREMIGETPLGDVPTLGVWRETYR
jgi:hypothetical protein